MIFSFLQSRKIYYFWGIIDLGYILHYLWKNILNQQIPFYQDILSFTDNLSSYNTNDDLIINFVMWFMFLLSFLLLISIPITSYLFLKKKRIGAYIALFQIPLRLITATPSLFFIGWFLSYLTSSSFILLLGLCFSEILKGMTIYLFILKKS